MYDGVFPDPARRLARCVSPPSPLLPSPAICQTNGPILDSKTAFDSSESELSECVTQFYPTVIDDVTGRVKGQIFEYPSLLVSPGKATVSDWNNKADGTTWIVSGILLSTLLRLLWPCDVEVIQGHEVRKVKFKTFGLGDAMQCFRSDFRWERKNALIILLERLKLDKIWK